MDWIDNAIEKAMGSIDDDPISLLKIAGMSALNLWKAKQLPDKRRMTCEQRNEVNREVSLAISQLNDACKKLNEMGFGSSHLDKENTLE